MECIDKNITKNLPDKILGRDFVIKTDKSVQIHFNGKRQVLSSSPLNGGYSEELESVFNFDEIPENGCTCVMRAPTYCEHMKIIASQLGLNPERSAGLSTAVQMTSAVYSVQEYKGLKVEAIVTGGINVNGGRAGDQASWDERDSSTEENGLKDWEGKPGTINILLAVNARLSKGAMTKAVITATEAKTAAIQELLAPSCYSSGIATGSGTDGIIVIGDLESSTYLTDAGQHSKLGELIGKAVIPALKKSMYLQTGICYESQHSVLARLERFGITESVLRKNCKDTDFQEYNHNEENVVLASLYAHLQDQINWGILKEEECENIIRKMKSI